MSAALVPSRRYVGSVSSQIIKPAPHHVMRGADGRIVVIPMHRVLKRGTLRNLIRQAGISLQAFIEAL